MTLRRIFFPKLEKQWAFSQVELANWPLPVIHFFLLWLKISAIHIFQRVELILTSISIYEGTLIVIQFVFCRFIVIAPLWLEISIYIICISKKKKKKEKLLKHHCLVRCQDASLEKSVSISFQLINPSTDRQSINQ